MTVYCEGKVGKEKGKEEKGGGERGRRKWKRKLRRKRSSRIKLLVRGRKLGEGAGDSRRWRSKSSKNNVYDIGYRMCGFVHRRGISGKRCSKGPMACRRRALERLGMAGCQYTI